MHSQIRPLLTFAPVSVTCDRQNRTGGFMIDSELRPPLSQYIQTAQQSRNVNTLRRLEAAVAHPRHRRASLAGLHPTAQPFVMVAPRPAPECPFLTGTGRKASTPAAS